ncbi:MAG: hypothetical protein DMF69_05115 [Acidobacteria bacterium]|nr:MAG: hypothetical protein DMF69_05115 [Acidobacteriota bacterium]
MNEEPVLAPRPNNAKRLTARFDVFKDSRTNKMFGIAEISALLGSCVVFLLALFSYIYFVAPARTRLKTAAADRSRLESNLKKLGTMVDEGKTTKQTVDEIADSLQRFETVSLVNTDEGRMQLYAELNQLILKNGLWNSAGPSYTALDPLGTKATPGKSVNTKWQSVYPGIGVMVTVEGPYQNVRRFIQDIERSKQFVIINQIELQKATANNSSASSTPEGGSGTRASLVSLQLNMSTYFQRAGSEPVSDASKEQ